MTFECISMFELTNDQRAYFAIPPVEDSWEKVEVTPSPYDRYYTYAYLDGRQVRKMIQVYDEQPEQGMDLYREFTMDELLSEDKAMILPKTSKGKLQKFTAANLDKRTKKGMSIIFGRGCINLSNYTSEKSYYYSSIEGIQIKTLQEFSEWVRKWCEESTAEDIADVTAFSLEPRKHQKYHEGDFFRFRIGRRLFGYGRILLDYSKLRKQKIPFWDIFMGPPLCVAVYRIVTKNPNLTPADLEGIKMLPSQMIMDNVFYYGECPIIGNAPISPNENNYPIHFGNTISAWEHGVRYQCGRTYIAIDDTDDPYKGFYRNGGIGWTFDVNLPILNACIAKNSNDPYWEMRPKAATRQDLRNPENAEVLNAVQAIVGLNQQP